MSNRPALTTEQQTALSTRATSVALDAGAGCGKTFVLTERFLSHLDRNTLGDSPAELHQLIAITFTDAAAREMRGRIRAACLTRLQNAEPEEGDYWLALLRSLDAARVSTIHSFCQTIVRGHAVELGIDPTFQLLEQSAAEVLRSECTDKLLRMRLDERDPSVIRLATEFEVQRVKELLVPLLEPSATKQGQRWLKKSAEDAVRAAKQIYQSEFGQRIVDELAASPALAALRELPTQVEEMTSKFAAARAELLPLLEKFADGQGEARELELFDSLARVQGFTKRGEWPEVDTFNAYKAACDSVRKIAGKLQPIASDEELQESAELAMSLLHLAADAERAFRQSKREAGQLDFDDLLGEAHRLLTDPEFVEAQQKLQRQVRLLMVDEFQDTDRLQVEIVKALVGSGLTEGKLFFVGDFKQSIYRFRGAEPDVFRELQSEIPATGRLPLSANFRSQPAILYFVNTLFAPIFGAGYTPLRPARPQVVPGPSVEFLWTPPAEGSVRTDDVRAEAQSIARRIRQMTESEVSLVAEKEGDEWKTRPVKRGDCVILLRALTHVQQYEEALREEELDYYLVGGRAFYAQQEVRDVTNLLRSVSSHCDEIALAGVLRSPFFSLLDETLYWLAERGAGLAAGLSQQRLPAELLPEEVAKVTHAANTLAELRSRKGRAGVADILLEAIERTSYDAILLSEFLGGRKVANLEKLIDQARSFDSFRPGDLDGFVRQLTEFVARDPKEALAATRSEDENVVRIMTVHASKGLEFPVVFVADMERREKADAASTAFSPVLGPVVKLPDPERGRISAMNLYKAAKGPLDQAEKDRLLYVACTRAADRLIFSGTFDADATPKNDWMKSLASRFDLATGGCGGSEGDQPLVQIVAPIGTDRRLEQSHSRGPDRVKALEKATAAKAPEMLPREVAPIEIDASAVKRFSISRLTGKLHHASRRPQEMAFDQSLSGTATEIDPRGLGTLVHAVLERVSLEAENQIAPWCDALAPLHLARNTHEAARLAEELVARFLRSERFERLGKCRGMHREVEFLLPWPPEKAEPTAKHSSAGTYLQGYIDCLIEQADGELGVLDYKTNRVDAAGAQAMAENYRLQLYVYALAVEQATGRSPSELCVHFLRPGVEVMFDWNESSRNSTYELVESAIAEVRSETATQSGGANWAPLIL